MNKAFGNTGIRFLVFGHFYLSWLVIRLFSILHLGMLSRPPHFSARPARGVCGAVSPFGNTAGRTGFSPTRKPPGLRLAMNRPQVVGAVHENNGESSSWFTCGNEL